jgi:hypothetical protein
VEKINVYRVLVGISEERRPLLSRKTRWEGNVKMNLRAREWGGTDWVRLAPSRDN